MKGLLVFYVRLGLLKQYTEVYVGLTVSHIRLGLLKQYAEVYVGLTVSHITYMILLMLDWDCSNNMQKCMWDLQ